MGIWDTVGQGLQDLLWALNRPQQMVYGAGQAGSNAMSQYAHAFDQAGANPYASSFASALMSIPSAVKGAFGQLSPQSTDIQGSDLTQGMTGNQTINNAMGLGLDFSADPTTLAGGLAHRLPAAFNTAKALKALEGTPYGRALDRVGDIKKYMLDIPSIPEKGEPLVVRTFGSLGKTPSSAMPYMGTGRAPASAGGAFGSLMGPGTDYPGIAFARRSGALGNVLHEVQHAATEKLGTNDVMRSLQAELNVNPDLDKLYGWVQRYYPHLDAGDPTNPSYDFLNELLSEATARGKFATNPDVREVQGQALDWIDMPMLREGYDNLAGLLLGAYRGGVTRANMGMW